MNILAVFCNDWNSEYNSGTGVCECKTGYTSNKWGCHRTWTNMADPISQWKIEVQNRVNAVFGDVTWPKFTANRKTRIYKRLGMLADLVDKKYQSKKCGIPSRAGNVNFQKGTSLS